MTTQEIKKIRNYGWWLHRIIDDPDDLGSYLVYHSLILEREWNGEGKKMSFIYNRLNLKLISYLRSHGPRKRTGKESLKYISLDDLRDTIGVRDIHDNLFWEDIRKILPKHHAQTVEQKFRYKDTLEEIGNDFNVTKTAILFRLRWSLKELKEKL